MKCDNSVAFCSAAPHGLGAVGAALAAAVMLALLLLPAPEVYA